MKKEIEIKMSTAALYDYLLYHTYTGMQGLIGTFVGALMIVSYIMGNGIIFLILGIVIIVYLPWSLFLKAGLQMKGNKSFQNPLHFTFSDEGISVSQGEVLEMQKWEDVHKVVSTTMSIIVYTSKYKATILPKSQLGNDKVEIVKIISTHMNPKKVKIRFV